MYDILIRNGTVFDGSQSPPVPADVAIKDGRVVSVGPGVTGEASQVIDATGQYVTPGFIDPHTHSDFSLMVEPDGDSKLRQGVTTEVVGNCGESPAPAYGIWAEEMQLNRFANTDVQVTWRTFGEYVEKLAAKKPIVNVIPLVGHSAIRASVMGIEDRAPSPEEMNELKRLTQTAMEEGAWGMSTGLIYPPGVYSNTGELVELSRVVQRMAGFYFTHIRFEAGTVLDAIKEAFEIGERAQIPVQISHVKVCGYRNWDKIDELMKLLDRASSLDVPVYFDQYPYIASATFLLAVLPEWTYVGGSESATKRLAESAVREQLRRQMEDDPKSFWDYAGTKDWDGILITDYPPKREYQGKTIGDIARLLNKDGLDAVCDLLVEANCVADCMLFDQDESNVRRIMQHPLVMVGSDGYSLKTDGYKGNQAIHPRSYGTFARVLGHYTREEKILDWSGAIHKMTGLPARVLGLTDRGVLEPGAWADVVVFDPKTVIDKATFTDAHQYADGIDYVLVNGQLAVDRGETTGNCAGIVLSPSR